MVGLSTQEREALTILKQNVVDAFGGRLVSIHLFGSKARGEAHEDSDVDVLIILNQRSWQDEKKIFSLVTHAFLKTGVILSPKIFSTEEVKKKRRRHNVFFQTIDKDLVRI